MGRKPQGLTARTDEVGRDEWPLPGTALMDLCNACASGVMGSPVYSQGKAVVEEFKGRFIADHPEFTTLPPEAIQLMLESYRAGYVEGLVFMLDFFIERATELKQIERENGLRDD